MGSHHSDKSFRCLLLLPRSYSGHAAGGGGHIFNISSLLAIHGISGGAAYCASKFGVNGLTEAMMQDIRYDGVRVSTILPGSVSTDFGGVDGSNLHESWKLSGKISPGSGSSTSIVIPAARLSAALRSVLPSLAGKHKHAPSAFIGRPSRASRGACDQGGIRLGHAELVDSSSCGLLQGARISTAKTRL